MTDETTDKPRKPRGFQVLSREKVVEVARQGGSSVPPENRYFARNRKGAEAARCRLGELQRAQREKESE